MNLILAAKPIKIYHRRIREYSGEGGGGLDPELRHPRHYARGGHRYREPVIETFSVGCIVMISMRRTYHPTWVILSVVREGCTLSKAAVGILVVDARGTKGV